MLSEFILLRPLWLLGVPFLWWLVFRFCANSWSKGNWDLVVEPHLLEFLTTNPAKKQRRLLPWIMALVGTLVLLALAGPAWEKITQPLLEKSNARIIVLDLSYSMLAADLKPSRIARTRFKLEDLLKRFVEGNTALIVYAGEPFVISPLTHDPATITALLPALHPDIMPLPGSRADLAIAMATDLLKRSRNGNGHVIWVTDGVEGQDVSTIANAIDQNQLSILAVGTESGSPIALSGGGFLKDKHGAIVLPKLNTLPLQELADQALGAFTRLTADDSDIERIIAAENIRTDFVSSDKQNISDQWSEEGPWLLLLVLPLTALFFRRGLLFTWGMILVLELASMPSSVQAFGWNDLWMSQDQQAAELLQQGKSEQAAALFENSEWKGSAAFRAEKYEDAIKQFSMQDNPRANYNRGNSLAFAGRLEDALAAYDKALIQVPDDEDARYNRDLIEKLLQRQEQQEQQNNSQQAEKKGQDRDSKKEDNKKKNENSLQKAGKKKESNSRQASDSQENSENEAHDSRETDENNSKDNINKLKKEFEAQTAAEDSQLKKDVNKSDEISPEIRAKEQALEQWLRKIPDDPGRLLRNKMKRAFQRRRQRQIEPEQYW